MANITDYTAKSNYWQFEATFFGEKAALRQIPIFYFPGWKVFVDEAEAEVKVSDTGLIEV